MKNKKWGLFIAIAMLLSIGIGIKMAIQKQPTNSLYEIWRSKYIVTYQDGAYVNGGTSDNHMALSEAQGYGMLITVLAAQQKQDTKESFDKLLKYYQKNTISKQNHLMRWKQTQQHGEMITAVDNKTNATDGDMDIAFALLQAHDLWGSDGQYNYLKLANNIMTDILTYDYNSDSKVLYLGNWAKNDTRYQMLVRTSDFIPTYFDYFYEKTHDKRWQILYSQSIKVLSQLSQLSLVGLMPDFIWYKNGDISVADSNTIESQDDGHYGWNANRIPLRLSYNTNQLEIKEITRKMLQFFNQQKEITAVYDLSGKKLNNYSSMAFTAPIAVAANNQSKEFKALAKKLTKQLEVEPLTGNYYADTLQVLAMLMIENNKVME